MIHTKYATLQEQECIRIADVDLALEETDREDGCLGWPSMEKNQERPFATKIGKQEYKETINDEGLDKSSISCT